MTQTSSIESAIGANSILSLTLALLIGCSPSQPENDAHPAKSASEATDEIPAAPTDASAASVRIKKVELKKIIRDRRGWPNEVNLNAITPRDEVTLNVTVENQGKAPVSMLTLSIAKSHQHPLAVRGVGMSDSRIINDLKPGSTQEIKVKISRSADWASDNKNQILEGAWKFIVEGYVGDIKPSSRVCKTEFGVVLTK